VNATTLELFVISKLPWIRRQQRRFSRQNRQSPRQYLDRESHYFLGRRYLLRLHGTNSEHKRPTVLVRNKTYMEMYAPFDTSTIKKEALIKAFYRRELRRILDEFIPKWEQILGVSCNEVYIKTMRTKWGSCQPTTRNILINLEMAKKPIECIEYVVAHELIHLIERTHNEIFQSHLNFYLPNWKTLREELNGMIV
jgi:predicted metal-dependent hydrolase